MIDKNIFKNNNDRQSYFERTYVGDVVEKLMREPGETRQPWEILRDELPGLLDFSDLPGGLTVPVELKELWVGNMLPTSRHRNPRKFVILHRWHPSDVDKFARDWAPAMLGDVSDPDDQRHYIQVPLRVVSTKEAPIALIIDETDTRYFGCDLTSHVYRWHEHSLWKLAEQQNMQYLTSGVVDSGCLGRIIANVLDLQKYIVVDDKLWIACSEPIVSVAGEVDWGRPRSRYGQDTEGEYAEGYTHPVHRLLLTNVYDFEYHSGRDPWSNYFAINDLGAALDAIDEQHAGYNAAQVEDGCPDEQIEALAPFRVTVFIPESIQFKRGPRAGEYAEMEIPCPHCTKPLVEVEFHMSSRPERVLKNSKISNYAVLDRDKLKEYQRVLFHGLMCNNCGYTRLFETIEEQLGADPIDTCHSDAYMDESMQFLAELTARYLHTIGFDKHADHLSEMIDDWRNTFG